MSAANRKKKVENTSLGPDGKSCAERIQSQLSLLGHRIGRMVKQLTIQCIFKK